MQDSPIRDKQLMDRVTGCGDDVVKKIGNRFPPLAKAEWSQLVVSLPAAWVEVVTMVEELRVSLFPRIRWAPHTRCRRSASRRLSPSSDTGRL